MKEALKVAERYPDIVCEVENVDTSKLYILNIYFKLTSVTIIIYNF